MYLYCLQVYTDYKQVSVMDDQPSSSEVASVKGDQPVGSVMDDQPLSKVAKRTYKVCKSIIVHIINLSCTICRHCLYIWGLPLWSLV